MTPQQAGVSAEAVAKLVERFRKRCAMKGGCQDSRDPEKCAWCECADLLEALATAPPEQAAPPKLHGTFTIADLPEDQPQAVSAGARSPNDEIHFQEGRLLGLTEGMHKCEELLAAHDQKVRAALQNLLDACVKADAHEELSEFIDGSLLDAARAALASGAEEKK